MMEGTRQFLREPENDPGIQPLLGQCRVTDTTPGLDEQRDEVPTAATVDVGEVQDCINELAIEQRRLLGVALRHARESLAHDGNVDFYKRTNPYRFPANWGLEVIDKGETQTEAVTPLYVVFVEPRASQP